MRDPLPRRLLRRTLPDYGPLVAAILFGMVLMLLAFLLGFGAGRWIRRAGELADSVQVTLDSAVALRAAAAEALAALCALQGVC